MVPDMMQRSAAFIAAGLLACLACGCAPIPVSQHPLSDQTNSTIDKELLGKWEYVDADSGQAGDVFVRIDPDNESRLQIELKDNEASESNTMYAFATTLHGQRFLSVCSISEQKLGGYVLAHYQVSDSAAVVYLLSEDYVVRSIDNKQLTGQVQRKRGEGEFAEAIDAHEITEIKITAKPDELRNFLGDHSGVAFDAEHPLILRRVVE